MSRFSNVMGLSEFVGDYFIGLNFRDRNSGFVFGHCFAEDPGLDDEGGGAGSDSSSLPSLRLLYQV